jgi:adhesin/invasin
MAAASPTSKLLLLSPKLAAGSMRIVLTWDASPKDMDSYLLTPSGCTVSYQKRECADDGQRAVLDLDNTHGNGPETTTIHKAKKGKYTFCVKQYSRHGSMSSSGATVRVFLPSGRTMVKRIGTDGKVRGHKGRGRTWAVLQIDGRTNAVSTADGVPAAF